MEANILIIEDDVHLRKILRVMLEKEGFRVSEAGDGTKGLNKFNEEKFDLVVTDIIMPETEGIETIFELKKITSDIKIIAISGGGKIGALEYLDIAKNSGVDKVLSKPFSREEFIESVNEVLSQ